MRKQFILSLFFFIFSIILLAYGYLLGEVSIGLIIIFPLITSNGLFGLLGIIFLIISFFTFFFQIPHMIIHSDDIKNNTQMSSFKTNNRVEKKIQSGGVIFIGPIPIIFGTNKKITRFMIISSMIILILIIFLCFAFTK